MAKMLGEGTATVAGETYHLRFDMNVLAELQERTGKSPMQILSALQSEDGSVIALRTMCHAMLKRYHPEASIEVAGDILSEDAEGVMAIINAALPQGGAGGEGNGQAKAG